MDYCPSDTPGQSVIKGVDTDLLDMVGAAAHHHESMAQRIERFDDLSLMTVRISLNEHRQKVSELLRLIRQIRVKSKSQETTNEDLSSL